MTYFKDATKFEFPDRNFQIFAQTFVANVKNFYATGFKIKFPIEWYASFGYCTPRIRNIADVLKIEHMQLLQNDMFDMHEIDAAHFMLYTLLIYLCDIDG